ncbi:MAG: ATP-dependent sacrificial sulfur transferase LarE [Actinomycetota bacterium]|nr:ATP-dependent sacrificial sulfur transferase LarE [Actinomycetota bacterium]
MTETREALQRLDAAIAVVERVVVAYSGGVDSALVAARAHEVLGPHALAATAVSPSLAVRERRFAAELARGLGWNHVEVATGELDDPRYVRNDPDRCFWCKDELFAVLAPIAQQRNAHLAVGTNADDLSDHRPGLRAAREHGVRAPLVEAGLDKTLVRAVAAEIGLAAADRPASPCLASRVAYGVEVTEERLRRIDAAEEILRELGCVELRVRDHGDLARIEVRPADVERVAGLRATIADRFKALGFKYVTLDLVGFRSGSMNEVLAPPAIPRANGPRRDSH